MILGKRSLINDTIKDILVDRCSATLEELGIAVSHSENFLHEMRCFTDSRKFPNTPMAGVKETVELQIRTLLEEISAEDILNNMVSPKESVEYFYNKYANLSKRESTLAKYEKLLKGFH